MQCLVALKEFYLRLVFCRFVVNARVFGVPLVSELDSNLLEERFVVGEVCRWKAFCQQSSEIAQSKPLPAMGVVVVGMKPHQSHSNFFILDNVKITRGDEIIESCAIRTKLREKCSFR